MDKTNYTTEEAIRERRKHLTFEDRVIIQALFKKGYRLSKKGQSENSELALFWHQKRTFAQEQGLRYIPIN